MEAANIQQGFTEVKGVQNEKGVFGLWCILYRKGDRMTCIELHQSQPAAAARFKWGKTYF